MKRPPLREILEAAGGDEPLARRMMRDYLAPATEAGVHSFFPQREEAMTCAEIACAAALDMSTAPAVWGAALDWPEDKLCKAAFDRGRKVAIQTALQRAADGEVWEKLFVIHQIFRPAIRQGVARVLGMDDEGCDFNLIAEEAVADACRYFERPEVLARMAERARRNPGKPGRILKAYARWLAKKRAITALDGSRPVSLDALEEQAERGQRRSSDDTRDRKAGRTAFDELRFKELVGLVAKRITQLPANQRRAMEEWLAHPDLSPKELAARLGVTDVCFRQLIHRAREELKVHLWQACGLNVVTKRRRHSFK